MALAQYLPSSIQLDAVVAYVGLISDPPAPAADSTLLAKGNRCHAPHVEGAPQGGGCVAACVACRVESANGGS